MAIRRRLAGIALGLGLIALVVYGCATNPVTGRKQLSLVSGAQEVQMGREGHAAILQEYGAYEDARLQAYVDSIGQALARVSHLPNLEWHFTLLDDPVVNAFALPGGYIYITRGIMANLNSEAQLAGVLGHEIGHDTARHTAQRVTQQQLAGLGLGIGAILSPTLRQYGELAQTAMGLLFLKYSRANETEADELGVRYSTTANYDPREIPNTYVMLRRVGERSGQSLPSFLSTHPDPGDRENRTRALATQAVAGKTNLVIRARGYVQRLDGITYGTDPRKGYFEGTQFYHPELGFQIHFPEGWKTQNSQASVAAAEPNNRAQMQLSLASAENLSPAAFVAQLQNSGKIGRSQGRTENLGGSPAWVGNIEVATQAGATASLAAAFIRKSDRLMFQILGQSAAPGDDDEARIFSSIRSFRGLTDPTKLDVRPNRVAVVVIPKPGSFQEVFARVGPWAINVEEAAILNNLELDEEVRAGELIKVVRPGR